jgi:hypothetical protein
MGRNSHTDMRYVTALLLDCELLRCDITKSSGWSPTFWRNLPSLYSEFITFNICPADEDAAFPNTSVTTHKSARCQNADITI